uniref:hypothetical protein n=1 Tax=Anaerococcus mediterraneensis TaxID=1870984 RepID=UPI00093135DF|nr:hypothetical protein [Anaerococcus mediterraneensis]
MKRKLNIFTLVFALIFSLHSGVYAMEETDPNKAEIVENVSIQTPGTENNKEQKENEANSQEDADKDHGQGLETSKEETPSPVSNPQPQGKSNEDDPAANPDPAGDEDTDPAADGDESDPADTPGENPDQGKDPKKEIDVSTNEDLKNLDEQSKNEKDPKKKAELEKKYNEKYAELLEGSGKLDDSVLDRIKDKERTDRYYELKAEYDAIKEKLKKEDPNSEENKKLREELDKLNQELAGYKIPRLLEDDEKNAKKDLADSVDVPGLKEKTPEAEKALKDYTKAKEDLEKALDPENPRTTSPKELKELVDAYTKARDALKNGIKDGKIKPSYTTGDPKVRIFRLNGGSIGEELNKKEDEVYYIPDNTSLNLLVDIKKDDNPQDFKFKIRADEVDIEKLNASAENLLSLNDKGLKLEKDEDGSYYFTINDPETFGIAQLRFNIPAFRAAFHKGFDLVIESNDEKITKKFRITKKGYEDEAKIEGPGSEKNDAPKNIPEIDAGKTQDSKVVENTDKVHDFFTYLKKSNTYIDDVFINSSSGESLPLSSVDITITVPKNQNEEFAEMIHKAGLKYDDIGNGQYRLKLDTKIFEGNLTKDKEGNLFYNDKKIEKSDLKDVILEEAGKRIYVDEKGKAHEITKEDYLKGEKFKVRDGRLYEKDGQNYKEIGKFDENGRIEKGDKVYELKEGTLTYYDKVNVYEGKVVNTDGKANPNLTPTPDGQQVVIKSGEGADKVKSYGGTIVNNAIYNNEGKKVKNDGKYDGKSGNIIIGDDGKAVDGITFDEKNIKEKDGVKTVKVGDKIYRVVTNPVFNKNGYIIDGLSYAEGPSLVDKYGKRMNIKVTKDGDNYTFTREVIKNGEKTEETKKTGENGIAISDKNEVIVDSTNKIVEPSGDNEIIRDKYFYNGKKFEKFEPATEKLNPQSKETYDGGKDLPDGKKIYQGSTNPDDYYKAGEDLYVKKTQGSKDYYVSADPSKNAEVLSEGKIAKIVQTIKKDGQDVEVVTDETSIFDAVANAKFGLRFPRFLAGKNIVYNVHADIKATYKNEKGEDVSIFPSEEGNIKKADKYFTLKNSQSTETLFFKNNPKELEKVPDYNFFNIFYRNSDDRKRDELIRDLLIEKVDSGKSEEKPSQDKKLSDEEKAKIKEKTAKMALLDKVQKELARLYDGAQFALAKDENGKLILDDEGNPKLVILDKDGKETDIDRALLWEIGFNNSKDSIFPENKDTKIIIEDHHLDNRLVYDEIIVNDTEENWKDLKEKSEKAKKAYEEAKKAYETDKDEEKLEAAKKKFEENEFEGSKNYFYLDQIGEINFGVNPTYTEGRFAPVGDDFTITGQEIIDALKANKDSITKGGLTYKITRDEKKGQVRISVINAFYKKADPDSENKFLSPVQEAYGEKIKKLNADIEKISTVDELKTTFGQMIEDFVSDQDQKDKLKAKFDKLMDDFDNKEFDEAKDKEEAFDKIKETLKAELDKLPLSYLDKSKGKYKNDDFRFNSIRIALKDSIRLGGPLSPETDKKLGITSVVIPDVDIPYTDEYGKVMTNKYMYVRKEIENILNNKTIKGIDRNNWDKSEETYRKVIETAYENVNKNIEEGKIKDLVEIEDENKEKVGREKYTVKKGSELDYEDLAPIRDKNGNAINPWYIGNVPASDKFNAELKKTQAYKDLENKKIDLPAYYMAKNGYDRRTYANKANYKLDKVDQADGIFGKEDSSKKKSYYPTIGIIIDRTSEAAGLKENADDKDADKFGSEGKNDSNFELSYEPDLTNSNSENPKVEKSVSEQSINIAGDEDKKVDFTIDVTVDKMTKDQKDLAKAMKENTDKADEKTQEESKEPSDDDSYGPNGHYVYKNSVIIDILPKIFELRKGSKLELEIDKTKLMANGANANFDNEANFKKFKDGIKYFYTDDLDAEIEKLAAGNENDKKKAEILRKAKKDSGKTFKKGEKIQAIIAYLPDFEAPHGSTSQFIFRLKDIYIDKKAYKDYDDDVIGTDYTNKAGFGDKSKFYYGDAKVNINKGPDGKVNKYLQILDEKGNVVDKDIADGWFKGNAKLKFGDKFNYRIKYRRNSGVVQIGGDPTYTTELTIKDILAGVKDGGLRPILRDFVTSDLDGFEVIYKVGEKEYTKEDIENGKAKLSDVTSLILKSGDKGYVDGSTVNFYLPMQIPTMDAKIEDGKIVYVGKDGKEIIGNADDFFDLEGLKDPKKDLLAENTVEDSNTVGVYLDKNRFLKVFKEFFDHEGEKITKDRPEVEFEIYQVETDENGQKKKVLLVDKDGNPIKLIANEANNFETIIENLPLYKKTVEIGENGEIIEKIVRYDYQIKEAKADGYIVEIKKANGDQLGFVFEVKNTQKPNEPEKPEEPENPDDKPKDEGEEPKEDPKDNPKENPKGDPKDNPKNPKENPKEDPKDNPENPDDKPEDKTKTPDEPNSPDQPYKPESPHSPKLPQTGAINDLSMVYVSGSLLAIAAYIRRKIRD